MTQLDILKCSISQGDCPFTYDLSMRICQHVIRLLLIGKFLNFLILLLLLDFVRQICPRAVSLQLNARILKLAWSIGRKTKFNNLTLDNSDLRRLYSHYQQPAAFHLFRLSEYSPPVHITHLYRPSECSGPWDIFTRVELLK